MQLKKKEKKNEKKRRGSFLLFCSIIQFSPPRPPGTIVPSAFSPLGSFSQKKTLPVWYQCCVPVVHERHQNAEFDDEKNIQRRVAA